MSKSLEIKGFPQRMWCTNRLLRHTNSDFYGIWTPPFMPYEPFLLGVGVVLNLLNSNISAGQVGFSSPLLPLTRLLEDAPSSLNRDMFKPFCSHSSLLGWVFGCVLEDLHKFWRGFLQRDASMRALCSHRPNCSHSVSQKVKRIRRFSETTEKIKSRNNSVS